MAGKTAQDRQLTGQIAAHTSWANTDDRSARTAPGRAAALQRFLDEAGGDPVKARHLVKAHFARLQLASVKARRKAREQAEIAKAAEEELRLLGGGEAE